MHRLTRFIPLVLGTTLAVLMPGGAQAAAPPGVYANGVHLPFSDANGDGHPDLVIDHQGRRHVEYSNGTGLYYGFQQTPSSPMSYSLVGNSRGVGDTYLAVDGSGNILMASTFCSTGNGIIASGLYVKRISP